MSERHLSIILLEDVAFKMLVHKVEKTFNISLPYKNIKGRFIAEGRTANYKISVIDRIDDLSDELCDEHHVLNVTVTFNNPLHLEKIENEIKSKLGKENIKWESGIWSKTTADETYRKIYPD